MRVFDRYLGQEVDLPRMIAPGRYRLLKQASLNGDVQLDSGQLVFSDGRDCCHIGGLDGLFQEVGKNEKDVAKRDLLVPAVTTLAQLIREGCEDNISPLMPAKTGELAELADLEKTLCKGVKHLREIDRRPRFSMHYKVDVSPLSRAKRVAPDAINYLAAHSEDWHRRTLSAVQPKRILALFSEDEWAIYENQVFARLLDRLDTYLRRRLADLTELEETYRDALSLGEPTHLYHRLRTSLCKLWGDALSLEETGRLLNTASSSIETIRDLAKKISVLRQGELYGHVPRNAHVPEQLRDTNILQHDSHYCHLRTLWLMYQKRSAEMRVSPKEIHDRNRRLFEDYVLYIGMLAHKVLAELKPLDSKDISTNGNFSFGGYSGRFRKDRDEWLLEYSGTSLTIVPAMFSAPESRPTGSPENRRVPVYLFPSSDELKGNPERSPEPMIVNPLEFYGLERVRALIESFLWRPLFIDYCKPIQKLPSAAFNWMVTHCVGKADGEKLVVTEPMSARRIRELENWLLVSPINEDTKVEIRRRVYGLQTLSSCRSCSNLAAFEPRDDGFIVRCIGCSLEWGLFRQNGRRLARFTVSGINNPSFETYGSWNLDITV